MSRISIWEVLGTFVVCVAIALLARAAGGGIYVWSVANDIDTATQERHLLRIVELQEGPNEHEQNISRAVAALYTILVNDPAATVISAFGRA